MGKTKDAAAVGDEKAKELKGRDAADKKHKMTVLGLYDKKVAVAKEARDFAASDYFQKNFMARQKAIVNAKKEFDLSHADYDKNPKQIGRVADLSPIGKTYKALVDATKDMEAFTHDVCRDAQDLDNLCKEYSNDTLFEKEMTETCYFNQVKGIIVFEKRK